MARKQLIQTTDPDHHLELIDELALAALTHYGLEGATHPVLINLSENATYRVDDPRTGERFALRVHREGYHSDAAIRSELAWLMALRADGVAITPIPLEGRDGDLLQTVRHPTQPITRRVVLFRWETGIEPAIGDDLHAPFRTLGQTAAKMHQHVRVWKKPEGFTRQRWDFETSLGAVPHWGPWRAGVGVDPATADVFAQAVALVGARLQAYGQAPERFNLVHGDLRLANLLVDGDTVKVIDFDDCGVSWLMYDAATTVSFFEDRPEVPGLLAAWVEGYRREAELSQADEDEIWTFVMLRRLLLVAWIGSHSETELAQQMGADYTRATVPMAKDYLKRFG